MNLRPRFSNRSSSFDPQWFVFTVKHRFCSIVFYAIALCAIAWSSNSLFALEPPVYQPGTEKLTGTIRIHGSETMKPLIESWATDFARLHPDVTFELRPEGSLLAIASFAEKIPAIGAMSRQVSSTEEKELAALGVDKIVQIPVARDHMALIVHPSNPLSTLTLQQLKAIYGNPSGPAPRWNEIAPGAGALETEVVLFGPNELSGTRGDFFRQVLGDAEPASDRIKSCETYAAIVDDVMRNPGAIGFLSLTWLDDTAKILAVTVDESTPATIPSSEFSNEVPYPLERELYLVLRSGAGVQPSLAERKFVEYALSEQGALAVSRSRFLPLAKERTDAALQMLQSLPGGN